MDAGAASYAAALEQLSRYRFVLNLGSGVASSKTLQTAALSIVNAGRRSCLGGVFVTGAVDFHADVPLAADKTMREALASLGASFEQAPKNAPELLLGGATPVASGETALHGSCSGWSAQVTPWGVEKPLSATVEFEPAGVLLAGLLVSEVFQYLRESNPEAAFRTFGLSLWRPEHDWRSNEAVGPAVTWLPREMWIAGLGQLGQGYLWTLGVLPYEKRSDVILILNDYDPLVEANESTSLLTTSQMVGKMKTREMAAWAEQHGFQARIVERPFAGDFKIRPSDPTLLLSGTDSREVRLDLEKPGFLRVIDCGLGAGLKEYLAISLHTLPGHKGAAELWTARSTAQSTEAEPPLAPAYQRLEDDGVDQCGIQEIAGRAVGVPFVGTVASAFVIAEAIRCANGWHAYDVIDLHLRNPLSRVAIANTKWNDPAAPVNPGGTPAQAPH